MQLKSFFMNFLPSTLAITWNNLVLAEVALKYDAFQDKTTITLFGEETPKKPLLHVNYQSNGQKLSRSQSAMVGFISSGACTDPNLIASHNRIQPVPGTDSPLNPHMIPMYMDRGSKRLPGVYSFNFYNLAQVKQLVTAKSVQYKLCGQVLTLSPQDQAELKEFLNYFSNK